MATKISTGARQYGCDSGFNSAWDTVGVLELRDGTRPSTADTTPSGTNLLASINLPPNVFADPSTNGVMTKAGTWTTAAAAQSGTATWYRFKRSTDAGTTNTTDVRMDGDIGTAGADLNLTSTQIIAGSPVTINTFTVTMPGQ